MGHTIDASAASSPTQMPHRGKPPSIIPATERLAIRNALVACAAFSALKGLSSLGRKKGGKNWMLDPELWRMTVAAGLVAELYPRVSLLTGRPSIGGITSMFAWRTLADNPAFHFNYKFLSAYLSAQVLVSYIPNTLSRHVLVMMLSASQLLGSWVVNDRLPRSYIRFLDREGKIDRDHLLKVRRAMNIDIGNGPESGHKWREMRSLVFPRPGGISLAEKYGADSIISMHKACVHYFFLHLREAVPFYVKIYMLRLVWVLVRKGIQFIKMRRRLASRQRKEQRLAECATMTRSASGSPGSSPGLYGQSQNSPSGSAPGSPGARTMDAFVADVGLRIGRTAVSIVRSSVFLSTYCTAAWWSVGMISHLAPEMTGTGASVYVATLLPGLAILLESDSQKETIANYCATFGLYPLLSYRPGMYDLAMGATAVACATGVAAKPFILDILWPTDGTKPPPPEEIEEGPAS